jgi:hypothetical protein
MRRDDYAVPSRGTCPQCKPYAKAEWRSTVWLEPTAMDVRFLSLHLTESGGDGFLMDGPHNVSIENCLVDKHYRQGMSVGSIYSLRVVNTTFVWTNGTAPSAGIDIEPDRPSQDLVGIVLRNVTLRGNHGGGLLINVGNSNATTRVSIQADDLLIDGEMTDGVGIGVGNVWDPPAGALSTIAIHNTIVRNTRGCGASIYRRALAVHS